MVSGPHFGAVQKTGKWIIVSGARLLAARCAADQNGKIHDKGRIVLFHAFNVRNE